jgi:hypothetical protein
VLMWVDIFTSLEAAKIPPIQIEHPEKAKFEIRIVCWRSKDIPNLDNGGSDLFASFAMEGSATPVQETDVHWRCKTGAAAWNWRIKIPIELPIKSRELGRLKIQMWEKNIVTSNEIVGEATVNIYDWLLLAYHRKGKTIQPFKEIKDVSKYDYFFLNFALEFFDDRLWRDAIECSWQVILLSRLVKTMTKAMLT